MRSCMSMMLFQGSPPHHRGRLAQGLQGQWAPQSNGIGFERSLRWWPEPRTRKTITMGEDGRQKNAGPSSSARNICVQCVCGNPVSLDNPYSPATLQPQHMNFTANSQQLEGKAPTDCTTPQTMDSQTALWDRTPRQHHKVHKDSETWPLERIAE